MRETPVCAAIDAPNLFVETNGRTLRKCDVHHRFKSRLRIGAAVTSRAGN